jgi:predicted Fe-S protein YdhL (DUF1289 family)
VGVCRVDASGQICLGCRRTLAEIGAWTRLTADQRREILARLAASRTGPGYSDADRA